MTAPPTYRLPDGWWFLFALLGGIAGWVGLFALGRGVAIWMEWI